MSLKNIEVLSLNPHFFKHLFSSFLSGYGKPCDIKLLFMVLPVLLYEPARSKLSSANSRSRLNSLFDSKIELQDNIRISGKTRLSGFLYRYDMLKESTKQTFIIMYNQGYVSIKGNYIILNQNISYKDYKNDKIKQWMKSAHYLGCVFSKSDEDNIHYFLGVE